jgi:hypothetical protein
MKFRESWVVVLNLPLRFHLFCLFCLPRTDGQDEDWRENDAELESSGVGGGVPTCRRHKLEVNFADIGWSHWIISPQKFEAHYCAGNCPFPLTKVCNTPYESGSQNCHCTVVAPQHDHSRWHARSTTHCQTDSCFVHRRCSNCW